ncbi:MAG: Gfo/Idh/MocA family oxidoreductase [Acidobacteriota bacterium]|nr:Gfo/Idh/MocA family oxidoreductase [Acidobacteriota bacterium]
MNTDNKKISTNKVRAAIVGAGLMGFWHARAARKVRGSVVAVFDINKTQADSLATKHSNAQSFDSLEKMLAEASPDVLHVCTPTATHQKIAELAIKAGVNLLIEKPIVQTAEETAALYELASHHKVLLCPVHQFVFQDGVRDAKKLLPKIGRIVHLQADICSAGGTGLNTNQVETIAEDILPHPLSLMQTFLGEDFTAQGWDIFCPNSGELRVSGKAREISLGIFVSMNSRPTLNSFQIFGTGGTIHLNLFHGFSVIEPGKTSRARKILHPFDSAVRNFSAATLNLGRRSLRGESGYPGLRRLIDEFYQAIKNEKPLPITPAEAIVVAQIRDILIQKTK